MAANVVQIPVGPRWRIMIAHQRGIVRHALRTMIEADDVSVLEVADGEQALAELAYGRFDLLILELDLPEHDGVTVFQMYQVLLAHQGSAAILPDIVFALPPEARRNAVLIQRLQALGAADFIDDEPRSEVAAQVEMLLRSRATRLDMPGKPAAA